MATDEDLMTLVRQLRITVSRALDEATGIRLLHPHWQFFFHVEDVEHRIRDQIDDWLDGKAEPELGGSPDVIEEGTAGGSVATAAGGDGG